MKKYLKSVAVGSALSLCLSGMPLLTVHGEEVQKIVVLGDSIASGENTYVSILQDCRNVEIQNFSSENYTTSDILNCFSDAQVQKALSEADIILINAGEHDVMDKFLETTHGFMEEFKFEKFLDVFTAQLADYGFQSEDDLLPYSNQMAADLRTNQLSAAQNVQKINQELENYPDAKIIWQTAYNMLDTIEMYDTLSSKRQMAYNAIMRPAKSVLNGTQPEGSTDDSWKRINDYIKDFGEAHDNCTVVDVYTGFAGKAYQYTNLYELDFTPTLLGHTWIADQIITELNLEKMGDVVGDMEVNAKDAAAVLVHAAEIGAGNGGSLTPEQIKKADVDGNGSVNAMDAAQILVYAASRGVGQIYHFKKSSATEELSEPDPTQPEDPTEELSEPDPTQPEDPTEELSEPDPTQPEDPTEELSEPDPTQPEDPTEELSEPDPTQPEDPTEELSEADPTQPTDPTEESAISLSVEWGEVYTSKEEVSLYLYTYHELPSNYITKTELRTFGWSGGDVWTYAQGKSIGGDKFYNNEKLLPENDYCECDIDYQGGNRNAKRLVYTKDCKAVYYTEDHYVTFTKLY